MAVMLMNRVETALVNSAPRRCLQRHYEVPWMRRLGAAVLPDGRVLETGVRARLWHSVDLGALRRRPS
ncbi:MAG: hypothetical protein ACRDSG_19060 [Pseudonocardiaceae bacterium]